MLKSMLTEEIGNNRELREYGDRKMAEISASYQEIPFLQIRQETDRLLREKPEDFGERLVQWTESELFEKALGKDEDLILFKSLVILYRMERRRGVSSVLDRVSSLEELLILCRRILFLLRRMELGFPEEEYLEILYEVREWELSDLFFLTILGQRAIWRKASAAETLGRLLQRYGYHAEGRALLAWADAQKRDV